MAARAGRALAHQAIPQPRGGVFASPADTPVALPDSRNGFAGCPGLFPGQVPLDIRIVAPEWKPVALCSSSFAVLYSGLTKTPLVVVERLSSEHLERAKNEQRTEVFFADPRLPAHMRAELSDYAGSGLDRGHMAPAGDQPDPVSMAQSFALSNIIPQDPENNRRIWSKIESDTRKFARRAQSDVFVFSGPVFAGERRTVGRGRVWVPSSMFKLVYDSGSGRAWAYILPNAPGVRIERPMGYASFVSATGWSLLKGVSQ
ncbi:DNA/RNA non-specific endonuclease [Variovorax gossypii]